MDNIDYFPDWLKQRLGKIIKRDSYLDDIIRGRYNAGLVLKVDMGISVVEK